MCSFFLQVHGSSEQSRDTSRSSPSSETSCFSLSNDNGPDAYQKCCCQSTSDSYTQNPLMQPSQTSLPLQCKQEDIESVQCSREIVCAGWTDLHTRSLISMATEAFHSVNTHHSTPHPCSSFSLTMPRFRINVDTLVGAKETDVDTGQAVIRRSVDLSVVSAYLLPQTQMNLKAGVPQSLPEPPQLFSITSSLNPSNKTELFPKSVCAFQANSKWNRSKHQCNGFDITKDCREEDKQEFFIWCTITGWWDLRSPSTIWLVLRISKRSYIKFPGFIHVVCESCSLLIGSGSGMSAFEGRLTSIWSGWSLHRSRKMTL